MKCPSCKKKMKFVNVPNSELGDSTWYCKKDRLAVRTFFLDNEALKVFKEFEAEE